MSTKKQREAILAAVCTMRNHPTADEIYTKLRVDYPRLSLGTVYRNLNAYAARGEVRRVPVPGSGDRFDFRLDGHEHLICDRCHRVYDINVDVNIKIGETANTINGHTLIFHGTCAQCSQMGIR